MGQRISTKEEYLKQINIVVEYINNHLDEPIDLSMLAEISHFSPYHFHRITRAFLKEPIGAYIVRMKVETAAKLLRYTELSISEIAYKVGYDVPSSLSKAFKQQYNISPIEYRNNKEHLIMKREKIDLLLDIKKPKIIDVPSKTIIYIPLVGEYKNLDFGGSWQRLWMFVEEKELFSAEIEQISIYCDDPKVTEADKLRTDICLVVKKKVNPQGEIGVKELKSGKFAMFLYTGTYDNLEAVYDTIYLKLLPKNSLILRNAYGFEKYLAHTEKTESAKFKTEIYIPIE